MKDESKLKAQLYAELNQARQTIADLDKRLESMKSAESDLRQVEEALRGSEATLRAFIDAIPEAAFLIDRDGKFLAVNDTLAKSLGRSPGSLVGVDAFSLISPELAQQRRSHVNEAIRTGRQVNFEDTREDRSFENYICPILDAQGDVVRIAVFAMDVTERREVERRLRESEDMYRSIFEKAPEGIVVVGVDGIVQSCNPTFLETVGYSEEAFVGKHFTQIPTLRLADLPWFAKAFITLLRDGPSSGPIEFPWVHRDGVRRWGEARVSLIKQGKRPKALQAIMRDITEHKRQGQLLEALNNAARATARAMTPSDIFDAIAEEFDTLGFACSIIVICEDKETLAPQYLSYETNVLRTIERLVGVKIDKFTLPIAAADEYGRVIDERETVFVEHAEDFMRQVLPDVMQPSIGRILRMLNVPQFILAPLIVEDRVIGIFSVQSDDLLASDGPAVTAFAHQVAGAWHKAQLLEQMRREVTERRRAEETLRESEERFRVAFHTSPDAINLNRLRDGLYVDINEGFTALTGYTRQDSIGKTSRDIDIWVNAEDRAQLVAGLREKGYVSNLEAPFRFKDGTVRIGLMSARTLILDGEPHILSVTRDMTERIQAEREIRRLQNVLQNITDSMPSVLITIDVKGRVLTWNPAAEALTGKFADEVVGCTLWDACPSMGRYFVLFDRVVQNREVIHQHRERLVEGGEYRVHEVSIFPLIADGLEGAVLRIDDVTRRVKLEEMMLQSAKMVSVGRLAAGVAHEINNPLGAMIQAAQMVELLLDVDRPKTRQRLIDKGVDPEILRHYLEDYALGEYLAGIRDVGGRAAKIVADLLSFSRQTTLQRQQHDLNDLVRRAMELAQTDYDSKGRYDIRNITTVWELSEEVIMVECDSQQIQQVVLNLVRNAAQAMGREGGQLTLKTSKRKGYVRLEVEDTGPGVPEAARNRLFEPFFTTKDVGEGTGLGLWLCWSIVVERHSGRIWVEDGTQGGARFVVELPLRGNLQYNRPKVGL